MEGVKGKEHHTQLKKVLQLTGRGEKGGPNKRLGKPRRDACTYSTASEGKMPQIAELQEPKGPKCLIKLTF